LPFHWHAIISQGAGTAARHLMKAKRSGSQESTLRRGENQDTAQYSQFSGEVLGNTVDLSSIYPGIYFIHLLEIWHVLEDYIK